MVDLATWLASLSFSRALRQLNWLVPWLQIIHILANGIILSAVVMIDLRIWGVSRSQASLAMARRFAPWIWTGLAVLTVSGILLILYSPRRQLVDVTFQVKMWVMGVAIAATLALLLAMRPRRDALPDDSGPPPAREPARDADAGALGRGDARRARPLDHLAADALTAGRGAAC